MLVLGVVLAVVFIVWDSVFAKKPFIPYRMVRNRTVGAACLLGALDFFHYAVFTIFFPSYLQVVGRFSPGHATRIEHVTFSVPLFQNLADGFKQLPPCRLPGLGNCCILAYEVFQALADLCPYWSADVCSRSGNTHLSD